MPTSMDSLLDTVIQNKCTDLHITVGRPPVVRINTRLRSLSLPPLKAEDAWGLIKSVAPEGALREFEERGGADFAYAFGSKARFRVSILRQKNSPGMVMRMIPYRIMSFDELGMPQAGRDLCMKPRGLVLVTGPTGCGKTTTLAAMIDHINSTMDRHIVTIEDPIEYYHEHKKSIVTQRQVGQDVGGTAEALIRTLRQDPDVIMVGEMRALDTIHAAITAAETGHLVFATLHTTGAARTVDRIIDAFPKEQQEQIRVQLSVSLVAVISQVLMARADVEGLVAAFEIMIATPAVQNLIREGKTYRIPSSIQTGKKQGMILLDDALHKLFKEGRISMETLLSKAVDLEDMLRKIGEGDEAPRERGTVNKARRLLGQVLKGLGFVHEGNIQQALQIQKKEGGLIGELLVRIGALTEEGLTKGLAEQAGLPLVDLKEANITKEMIDMVPASIASAYRVVPFSFDGKKLVVAMADPGGSSALDDLRFMVSCGVEGALAPGRQVDDAIARFYSGKAETVAQAVGTLAGDMESSEKRKDAFNLEDPRAAATAAPVVKLLNLILLQAIKDKAADIHFEPFENEFKIRYRIDGVLYEMAPPPKELAQAVISRIKVMSNLDIAETRVPQDGRIELTIMNRAVDLRVSTLPTMFGESVVMRVLDRSVVSLDLENLGMRQEELATMRKLNTLPNGIILVTGPTGCGKTTTLYSALREANDISVKIITTEDPVEYDLEGIIQIQINDEIGLDYAACLRSILRQNPDKILVGEIRDLETAGISVEASLTGHVVFSTLHTNDAPSAVTRMLEIGVEPFLIAATLEAVIAQRLVRKICNSCRMPYQPDQKEIFELNLSADQLGGKKFFRGKGCPECNNTGFRGRTGIFEIMLVNEDIKQLIMDKASSDSLRRAARKNGMRTLRESGMLAVFDGVTSVDEILHETSVV